MDQIDERRQRQRVMVDQGGGDDFRLECDGRPVTVRDVSLDGFAMLASTAPDANHRFSFRITHRTLAGAITGTAQVVNYVRGATGDTGVAGCRIFELDGDGPSLLSLWLSTHVVSVASVPLTEDEARRIVAGPSLV